MSDPNEQIKVIHEGVEITYIEGPNEWEFQLRGRLRRVLSLSKAKEAIDKEPVPNREPFKRIDVLTLGCGKWSVATVTSYAGLGAWSQSHQWWVTIKEKGSSSKRERCDHDDLYLDNEGNHKCILAMERIDREIAIAQTRKDKILETMEHIPAPAKGINE
jgi:hypothetical protein